MFAAIHTCLLTLFFLLFIHTYIAYRLTTGLMMYMYFAGLGSETAKKESKYWQRFHAGH
jgi:hypothetical protein